MRTHDKWSFIDILPLAYLAVITLQVTKTNGGYISRETQTRNVLEQIEARIDLFFLERHTLPKSLTDLPKHPDKWEVLTDGWDKLVDYAPQADGSVILTSRGEHERDDSRKIRFSMLSEEEHYNQERETSNNFDSLEGFIREFAKRNVKCPTALRELPSVASESNYTDFILDGWGNPIEYKLGKDRTVTLISHGRDGKQIFSSEFIVPPAKDAGMPLTAVQRDKLRIAVLGKYSAVFNGSNVSMVVDDKTIRCAIGSTTTTYRYDIIGASGDTLVVKFGESGSKASERATIELHGGKTLQFNFTDDPRLAYEWVRSSQ